MLGGSLTDWLTAGSAVISTIVLFGAPALKRRAQRKRDAIAHLALKLDPAGEAFSILRISYKPSLVQPATATVEVVSPGDVQICAPKSSRDTDQTIGAWARVVEMTLLNQPVDTLRTDLLTRSGSGGVVEASYRVTITSEDKKRRLLRRVVTLSCKA